MNNAKTTISIIIPTYNRGFLLGRAIMGVLRQTVQDFELIIVDDGSTDNTEEVVRRIKEREKRIVYIKHVKNKGGSAARNTGIREAKGEYLCFLDSDDEWLPGLLECQMDILRRNQECVICSLGHRFINEETGRIIKKSHNMKYVQQEDALRGECSTTNDFMVKRDAINAIGGFDEGLPARQDWDVWIRILWIGLGIQVPINMVNIYVRNAGQISSGIKSKLTGTIMVLEKHKMKS